MKSACIVLLFYAIFATSLHEWTHWSGHKSRLDRDLKSRINEKAYAAEELIAELTAAFLCAYLGITGELRHADYIASWISLLKEDGRKGDLHRGKQSLASCELSPRVLRRSARKRMTFAAPPRAVSLGRAPGDAMSLPGLYLVACCVALRAHPALMSRKRMARQKLR